MVRGLLTLNVLAAVELRASRAMTREWSLLGGLHRCLWVRRLLLTLRTVSGESTSSQPCAFVVTPGRAGYYSKAVNFEHERAIGTSMHLLNENDGHYQKPL